MPPFIELADLPSAAASFPRRPSRRAEGAHSMPYQKAWGPLLQHLATAGQIGIGTSLPGIELKHRGHWPGVDLKEEVGLAVGRRFQLRLFFEHWFRLAELCPDAGDMKTSRRLGILDARGLALMELELCPSRRHPALETLLQRHLAPDRPDLPDSAKGLVRDAQRAALITLPRPLVGRGESPDPDDLAEATGQLRLSPARLRGRGRAMAVDAELIPCFIEALAEQALPIRLLTGTAGVAHRIDGAFFYLRREGTWLRLKSDSAELRIDASKIDAAWVLKVPGVQTAEQASLRLYDPDGRSLVAIGAAPGFDANENPIWRTLINALLD
jgi:putative heme degradation protein